jgi:RNase P subunit RPR2
MEKYYCKYCGAELAPTMNCPGCGSSTGEAIEDLRYVRYGCHNCGSISDVGGICTCGHAYDRL